MKSIFTCIAALGVLTCYSQTVTSLGPFKIGKTTISILDSFRSEHVYFFERGLSTGDTIIKDHGRFDIGAIDLAGFFLTDVQIDFYKDTLYSIKAKQLPDGFADLFIKKYGIGKVSHKKTPIKCRSSKKGIFTLFDESVENEYSSGTSFCRLTTLKIHDNRCYLNEIQYLDIVNVSIYVRVSAREENSIKSLREKIQKKQLEGL